ncbi:response regulator [Mucilaginibacter sp. McL0603]|uniref:response regulator n=1 Tax=Mucilaginibacter sp. McL0603 TaxID=3415670 RepID=UPI003CF1F138
MRKLVIIDDDPIDHFMMKHILKDKNYFDATTYTFYGELVLDYIEEYKAEPEKLPDVIFLDLNMPEFSGWDFLERMEQMQHEVNKNIQVYIISSSVRHIDKEVSAKYPFVNDFISKPVEVSEIERIVGMKYVD